MNFHEASRVWGVTINFDFPAGGGEGGSCLNCSNKIIKNISSLASVLLINLRFYFCKLTSCSSMRFFVIIMLILIED